MLDHVHQKQSPRHVGPLLYGAGALLTEDVEFSSSHSTTMFYLFSTTVSLTTKALFQGEI